MEKVDFQKVQIDRSGRVKERNSVNRTGLEQRENGMQILNKASFWVASLGDMVAT